MARREIRCPRCKGAGEYFTVYDPAAFNDLMGYRADFTHRERVERHKCEKCDGTGVVEESALHALLGKLAPGRIGRKEYTIKILLFIAPFIILSIKQVLFIITNHRLPDQPSEFMIRALTIYFVCICTPAVFFLSVKRLHDCNITGKWTLIMVFIPPTAPYLILPSSAGSPASNALSFSSIDPP